MSIWTAERIETLTMLWSQGVSAAGIAAILGDISRNAIMGKASRLKLGDHPSFTKLAIKRLAARKQVPLNIRRGSLKIKGRRQETGPDLPPDPPKPPIYLGLRLLELGPRQCRYSHSESSPYLFCGAATDTSWCPYHHRIVYRGLNGKRPV